MAKRTEGISNRAGEIQRLRDANEYEHHVARVEWLTSEAPAWACGTPVLQSDIASLLRQSRGWLHTRESTANLAAALPA